MSELGNILLEFSNRELDASMKPLIQKWSDPPKAIEILKVLDHCINGSLASGFVVAALQASYAAALKAESTTHEALLPLATWRRAS